MKNIFVLAKRKQILTVEELFELTAGILGHLTEVEQLEHIQLYVHRRIEFLKEKQMSRTKTD